MEKDYNIYQSVIFNLNDEEMLFVSGWNINAWGI